jgi:glycosyltransferase involved in cell wall biosynthesis
MKLLFLAYFFPPLGGGGVQRSSKFIKYLASFGYDPIVLTVNEDTPYKHDDTLLQDIPHRTRIVRTTAPGFEWLNAVGRWLHATPITSFVVRLLTIPDPFIGWYRPALKAARAILRSERIPVLITTSSPFTTHLIGRRLKREFPQLVWIADFRDEWSSNPWIHYPTPFHRRINQWYEHRVIQECDHVVGVTKLITADLLKSAGVPEQKGTTISNGFDEDDITKITHHKPNLFTITYTGSLYGEMNPVIFFQAIRLLEQQHPLITRRMRIVFAGGGSERMREVFHLTESWWEDLLVAHGYLSHEKSLFLLGESSMLLLLLPTSRGPNAMSGKLFEYLASGVPIFALVAKETDAARILQSTNTGVIVEPENPEQIAVALARMMKIWENQHQLPYQPVQSEVKRYNRRILTEQLSTVITKLVRMKKSVFER